jgi:hypothetical protein
VGTVRTELERITAVEVRLKTLEETVSSMDKKLDSLLELKYKGQGAFILASMLFGTSIVGTIAMIVSWFRS